MGKKDKVRMPTGMAGLTRFNEELKEAIKIKPEHILYFAGAVIVIELILKFMG